MTIGPRVLSWMRDVLDENQRSLSVRPSLWLSCLNAIFIARRGVMIARKRKLDCTEVPVIHSQSKLW